MYRPSESWFQAAVFRADFGNCIRQQACNSDVVIMVKKKKQKSVGKVLTIVLCGAILTEHVGKERKRAKVKTLIDLKKVLDKY